MHTRGLDCVCEMMSLWGEWGCVQLERAGLGNNRGKFSPVESREGDQTFPLCNWLLDEMRSALLLLLLLVPLINTTTTTTVAGGKTKKEKSKPSESGSECTGWRYGNCVPSNGDCGPGFREMSCDQRTVKIKCKVPCTWKRQMFEGDCIYRFGLWGECDQSTGRKTRTGTLRKALNDAECQQRVSLSTFCSKQKRKPGKKRKGKGN